MLEKLDPGVAVHSERQSRAAGRAAIYNILSSVYARSPSGLLLGLVCDGIAPRLSGSFPRAARYLPDFQIAAGPDQAALGETLSIEYTRLFLGPGPDYLPPYESVQRKGCLGPNGSDQGPSGPNASPAGAYLWGDVATAVQRCYAEAGLTLAASTETIPDHLSTELGLMSTLCLAEVRAWGARDEVRAMSSLRSQWTFLADHLLSWAPDYCHIVELKTAHPFYAMMAALTAEFLTYEADEMDHFATATTSPGSTP